MQSLDRAIHSRHATPPPEIKSRSDRKTHKRITPRQRLFVEECLTDQKTFDEVMKHHYITTERFVNWMMQPAFRRYLKRVVNALREQAKFIMAIGKKRGAM